MDELNDDELNDDELNDDELNDETGEASIFAEPELSDEERACLDTVPRHAAPDIIEGLQIARYLIADVDQQGTSRDISVALVRCANAQDYLKKKFGLIRLYDGVPQE